MRYRIAAALVLLLASAGESEGANEPERAQEAGGTVLFDHGEWEVTTEILIIDSSNMPGDVDVPLPAPTTVRMCMTPEQASRPFADILTGSGESGGCSFDEVSIRSDRIHATGQCHHDGYSMRTTLDGHYTARRFEIDQRVAVSDRDYLLEMSARSTGHRLGDCSRAQSSADEPPH